MQRLRYTVLASTLFAAGAFADVVTVLPEHRRAESWNFAPDQARVLPGWPDAVRDRGQDACVNLGFLIAADGRTSSFVELKSWSSAAQGRQPSPAQIDAFVQVAAAAVSRWRFVPAAAGGHHDPVYTSAAFAFVGDAQAGQEAVRAHCHIDDLRAFVGRATGQARNAALLESKYEHDTAINWECTAFSNNCVLYGDYHEH